MEERSIVEPIRNLVVGKGAYYEAMAKAIDTKRKQLVACFPADAGLDEACFQISYDVLIVAVGSVNNTFGIQVSTLGGRSTQRVVLHGSGWVGLPAAVCGLAGDVVQA